NAAVRPWARAGCVRAGGGSDDTRRNWTSSARGAEVDHVAAGVQRNRGALKPEAAALEEGAGVDGELLMGDVAVDVGAGVQAHLLAGDGAGDAAAHLHRLGLHRTLDLAALADGQPGDRDIAADHPVDLKLALAAQVALDGDVVR